MKDSQYKEIMSELRDIKQLLITLHGDDKKIEYKTDCHYSLVCNCDKHEKDLMYESWYCPIHGNVKR